MNTFAMQHGTEPNWNSILTTESDLVPNLSVGSSYVFNLRYQSPTSIEPITLTETQYSTITIRTELLFPKGYIFLRKFGNGEGTLPGQFRLLLGIDIDRNKNLIYSTDKDNNRIQEFDTFGNFIRMWGEGYLSQPKRIAIDVKNEWIYVDGDNGKSIQKFTSQGDFITKWNGFNLVHGIGTDSIGNVYVGDYFLHHIKKFDFNGNFLLQWGQEGNATGQFSYIYDLAIGLNDYVYVVERWNHRVQKFDSNGNFISMWGTRGTGSGQFEQPLGIGIDSGGWVYVCDRGDRVQIFDPDGALIKEITGLPYYPTDVAVDNERNIYISNYKGEVFVYAPQY